MSDRAPLLRTAERLAALVGAAADGIASVGPDGLVETLNRGGERTFGVRAEAVIGRPATGLVRRTDAAELARALRAALAGEVTILEVRRADEGGEDLLVTVSPLPASGGGPAGAALVARDLSTVRGGEAERRHAASQAERDERLEALGRLAGGVAHDFNNLLTLVNNYADLLLEDLPPDAPERAYAQEIRGAGTRGARMTRQLLTAARRAPATLRRLRLPDVVGGHLTRVREIVGAGVQVEVDVGDDLTEVLGDRADLEHVLEELARNARDALGGRGRVTVSASTVEVGDGDGEGDRGSRRVPSGRYACLAVADDGPGMDAATLEHALEPFFTTRPRTEAVGLGLSTVHGIVRDAGGHVRLRSTPGEGTTVQVLLPALTRPDEPARRAPAAPTPVQGRRVLVVDDEDGIRTLCEVMLRRAGFDVTTAAGGDEALDAWAAAMAAGRPFELVLTDMVMPGMSGIDVVRALRERDPSARVVLMSGYSESLLGGEGEALTGGPVLHKPFPNATLVDRVLTALRD